MSTIASPTVTPSPVSASPEKTNAPSASQPPKPEPCILTIFGATGDLMKRKLMPAIYNLTKDGLLHEDTVIVGFARRPKTDAEFRAEMLDGIRKYSRRKPEDPEVWKKIESRIFYHQSTFDDAKGYTTLADKFKELDDKFKTGGRRMYYLSVSPTEFGPIINNLGNAGLGNIDPYSEKAWRRIIVEKPFGKDLASARELNHSISRVFSESQVFRIDHYLGKQTVQNMLVFRFANGIFEPTWNRTYVDHVQITVTEKLGIEGRGPYYEESGLLRDMVQNHLMQLLALTAMEPPVALDGNSIRDEKVKVLKAIQPLTKEQVAIQTVRGQYIEGDEDGKPVIAYRKEERVDPRSNTETFAAVKLMINNWRWQGVPFYLRSGKRLAQGVSEISVHFKPVPGVLFHEQDDLSHNILTMRVQPNEGISLQMNTKTPGTITEIVAAPMDFQYNCAFKSYSPEAYERLLLDAIIADPTLFIRDDEVEYAWRIIDSIENAWDKTTDPVFYKAGTWGPKESDDLLARDGHKWWVKGMQNDSTPQPNPCK